MHAVTLTDIRQAAQRIAGVAHRTPVLTSQTLNDQTKATIFLKAEPFQRAGSFKFRGAYNGISSLTDEEKKRGVVAASSGNHAQALALAGRLENVPVTILMPEDAPRAKLAATRGYGAEVIFYDRYTQDRDTLQLELQTKKNAILLPPFDHPAIVAGTGTIALEILDDVENFDILITPVSGGGLIAGCAIAAKTLNPNIQIWGVEPAEANDTQLSLKAKERVKLPVSKTIADGLTVPTPGAFTFEINRRLVDGILTATDAEIVEAMRFFYQRMKLVVEPSGAICVAALLAQPGLFEGKRIAVVLSGGNVDLDRFCALLNPA